MELVALSSVELNYLARDDPVLWRVFHGVHPSDGLPSSPTKRTRAAYVVNTDPTGEPGEHWLGVWTEKDVRELFDSYGLPLTTYEAPGLHEWIGRHWKYVVRSDRTLQAYDNRACGHYASVYLKARARLRSLLEFL